MFYLFPLLLIKIRAITNRASAETYYYKNGGTQWEKGPKMQMGRYNHACGSFSVNDNQVLVVAGTAGSNNKRSVEFLDMKENNQKWIDGNVEKDKKLKHVLANSF